MLFSLHAQAHTHTRLAILIIGSGVVPVAHFVDRFGFAVLTTQRQLRRAEVADIEALGLRAGDTGKEEDREGEREEREREREREYFL